MAGILRRDDARRIRPLALQDALAADLLPGMSEEDRFASFHLVGDEGEIHSGGAALPVLLGDLRGTRLFARALAAVPPLTNLLYRLVAANRSRLGPLIPDRWKSNARELIAERQRELPGDPVAAAEPELSEASP
jgi:predicted DCC family thiol-disulfide oxidoreductase YuxK